MAKGHDDAELIKILQKRLVKNSTVLELGIGPGKDLEILNRTYTITDSDNSQIFLYMYKKQNHDANLLKLDVITLSTNRTFDCIYSNKVPHHISKDDLTKSFQRRKKILNPNRINSHSFWKGDKDENYDGLLFTKYQSDGLKEIIRDDFKILTINSYSEMENDDSPKRY